MSKRVHAATSDPSHTTCHLETEFAHNREYLPLDQPPFFGKEHHPPGFATSHINYFSIVIRFLVARRNARQMPCKLPRHRAWHRPRQRAEQLEQNRKRPRDLRFRCPSRMSVVASLVSNGNHSGVSL